MQPTTNYLRFFQRNNWYTEEVTWDKTVSVSDLERSRKYPILRAKRITTKKGSALVLNIWDSMEDTDQFFLPKSFSAVMTEDIDISPSQASEKQGKATC